MTEFRNPAHLLGLRRDPAMERLLRACGVEEAHISGASSDRDAFLALACGMPLCRGHRLAETVNRVLREETGVTAALCPHTADGIWSAWVDVHWYGLPEEAIRRPAECPCCGDCEPTAVSAEQVTILPSPLSVGGENLGAWTRAWERALLDAAGEYPLLTLPSAYEFRRPDPYHAGEVICKLARGTAISPDEENLLITQALRTWGLWSLKGGDGRELLLCGGASEAVIALLAYLRASRALAPMAWIPRDPADAGDVSGLYACVRTGLNLSACQTPAQREAHEAAYRRCAPWGRAILL